MSDSEDPKPSIPAWQRSSSTNSSASASPASDNKDGKDAATDRTQLLEQATVFLQDDSIRDAPTDRKIAFLESKGLTSAEIDSLLGVSRNPEATSSDTDSSAEETQIKDTPTTSTETPSQSPSSSAESTVYTPSTSTTSSVTQSKQSAPRDVPPIITYPEFLLHQSKPPPLVTLRSVLYTLYGAAGLSTAFYGASEYLVKPMLATLTEARHDLASTTQENLRKLNEKLEQNVSELPASLLAAKPATSSADVSDDDIESITSDPTELFHRDIGTQTSQDLTTTTTSSSTSPEPEPPTPLKTVTTHQTRLEQIGSHLRSLADAQSQSSTLNDTTHSRVADLQRYLDTLLYSKSSYSSYPYSATTGYGMYSTPGLDSGSGAAMGVAKGEEDAIAGFRAEIRGVKGALLSARNFPSGRGRVPVRASGGK
ncbi:peroxisomal membrane anchor protein conserved region-domain-containing protein [Aspergillus egyptiacus]|nr:peroxisomal membrane anchor protein conserved region-domain-containing protein [Aspergillus egyptiacus]